MVASLHGPKGRPPLRKCPDDFDIMFVEQGRLGCEAWYRASRMTVNRWMTERGAQKLIDKRAAYVAHLRAKGEWMTRSTRLVVVRAAPSINRSQPVRDRRKVSFTLTRHAAQYLRINRNGGWIVSPTPQGDWWIGSRRYSAAQLVDLACSKGFDRKAVAAEVEADPVGRLGDYQTRSSRIAEWDKAQQRTRSQQASLQTDNEPGVEDER